MNLPPCWTRYSLKKPTGPPGFSSRPSQLWFSSAPSRNCARSSQVAGKTKTALHEHSHPDHDAVSRCNHSYVLLQGDDTGDHQRHCFQGRHGRRHLHLRRGLDGRHLFRSAFRTIERSSCRSCGHQTMDLCHRPVCRLQVR